MSSVISNPNLDPITNPTPGIPNAATIAESVSALASGGNLFAMYYRHGVNPGLTKIFYFDGTFQEAKKRAEAHCGIMGYKYIWLRPFIVDLDAEESTQLSRG